MFYQAGGLLRGCVLKGRILPYGRVWGREIDDVSFDGIKILF
jgi:hypothetical protein